MTDLSLTDVKVLDTADEGDSYLYVVLQEHVVSRRDDRGVRQTFQSFPATPVNEAQASMTRLLEEGLIVVHETRPQRDLTTGEAVAVIANDDLWAANGQYGLHITERGRELLLRVWPRFFPEDRQE